MSIRLVTMADIHEAEEMIREHVPPAPLIRSFPLEKRLGMPATRRVWLKDYGWTPSGSFKLMGATNWMAHHATTIGDRPVAAHSSGNFASGIAYAGMRFQKRVIVVMPDSAPQIKFERTKSFGAEVRTYNIARDYETGERDKLTRQIAEVEGAVQASPYDDPYVIAGNGVGALDTIRDLQRESRTLSHFICPVSGGGLMAGQAIAVHDAFPHATIIGTEPALADDFRQSMIAGKRVRLERPTSICDGLCSYDVGEHNWPILKEHVNQVVAMPDVKTQGAMRWLYDHHGLRVEPSGAITVAAALSGEIDFNGEGDIVIVVSGRNVDEAAFQKWTQVAS